MAELDVVDEPTLRQVFEAGWEAQRKIDSGELSSNTDDYKSLVREGVSSLEKATHMVNSLSLFSGNEAVEELPTSDLRYLLLPALLGDLTLQQDTGERLDLLHRARVYLVDYLQRCKDYSITEEEPPSQREPVDSGPAPPTQRSFGQAAADRTAKIARLRAKKEMEKKIEELAGRLKASSSEDDDLTREHLLSVLKYWVLKCQEGVASTDQEMQLLEGMGRMRDAPGDIAKQRLAGPPMPGQSARPPLVITRDMLKGKVFGAGYPSLPAMSVQEFFDQQYKEQLEKQRQEMAAAPQKSRVSDDEGEGKDEETEESMKRAREFDEFKDSNRRGWGNRKNMG